MALNIVKQSGDFDKYVKFNGKSGRWSMKDDAGVEQEISPTAFVADFDNIKTGWLYFAAGVAPDKVFDDSLTQPAPKPSEFHKRGFSVRLFSNASFNGVVELSANSMHICNAINEIYEQYEQQKDANPGMLPVVSFKGTTPMKDKHGTNYKPNFAIEKWAPRPAELNDGAAVQQALANQSSPAPAPVAASVSEF